MASKIFQICTLLLVLRQQECSISEEKCQEYSSLFFNQKLSVDRPGGAGKFGKVDADFGEFPHMVALGYPKKDDSRIEWQICAGSLISEQFVLTSGACTGAYGGYESLVTYAKIGVHDVNKTGSFIQEFNITKIYVYEGFKLPEYYNDIALLKLNRPVVFTKHSRPACLHNSFVLPLQLEVSVTSWADPDFGSFTSSTLKKVYLNLFSHDECSTHSVIHRRLPHGILDKLMICAGGRKAPKDTCQGDGGSPLQFLNKDDNIYEIVGITTIGHACGLIGPNGLYTRVAAYIPWIESVVWPCDTVQSSEELNSYIEVAGAPPKRPGCSTIIKE